MRVDGARAYAPDGSRAWRFAWRARPSQSVRSPAFGTGSRVAIRMTLCVREIAFACARMRCAYKFEIARMQFCFLDRYFLFCCSRLPPPKLLSTHYRYSLRACSRVEHAP